MTKIPQLPITDLARIAPMEPSLRLHALNQVKSGGAGGKSYEPTRRKLPDIVNRAPGPFPSVRTPWTKIEQDIIRLSKNDDQERMNKAAAKSIYNYYVEHGIEARELEGFPLTFSIGLKLTCWSPALLIYPDRLAIAFWDMRRNYRLTYEGLRFIFSVIHIALRENNPDYAEVESEVLRLRKDAVRSIRPISGNGMRLFSYDELEVMVTETYRLWEMIQAERRDKGTRDDWGPDALFG
jgi:hypothetical protein